MKVTVHRRLLSLVTFTFLIGSARAVSAPQVWPPTQHQRSQPEGFQVPTTAGLIIGEGTDQPALRVAQDVLKDADVHARGSVGQPVVLAGCDEASAARSDGLNPEKYVLGIGRDAHRQAVVVLSGRDQDGTFYAGQSLRQLVMERAGRSWLPGAMEPFLNRTVEVSDKWLGLRGVVSGSSDTFI
ncbi:hypothetical protein N7532_002958 [Penicillium argentinense]|uniref:Beta-hexosaminidase bacterial type N-terminal domain-containing protein n=1 Tax=Penicillium argentinense TaxID=1131581 RepID=A0A9W9G1M1_9EURO|nr:uncharacterized protein N7532_002958 [Penicillium argentinense]KAJ5110313.1 hypothetical protein N7532_002958 [Penicillium argentinense]